MNKDCVPLHPGLTEVVNLGNFDWLGCLRKWNTCILDSKFRLWSWISLWKLVSCLKSLFNSLSREIFIYIKQYCFLSVASSMTCTVYVPVNTRPSVVHAQYFSHFMTVQMACTFPISLAFSMWEEVAKDKNKPIVSFQCVEHPFSLKYFHSTFCIFLRLNTQTFTRSLFIESSSDYLTMKNVDRKKEMDRKSQVWGSLNVMLLGCFYF